MTNATEDFKVHKEEFDGILRRALARTYATRSNFASEAEFKYELFHQLHGLEIGGHKLGVKVPGHQTCTLHVEANAVNGLRGKSRRADLVVCDPTDMDEFNYRVVVAIELKTSLDSQKLNRELEKFAGYNGKVPNLYIISANQPRIHREAAMGVVSEHMWGCESIEVIDRTAISNRQGIPAVVSTARSKDQSRLVENVTKCIKTTLNLYGRNSRDPYHSFFWRNYEYENEKGWTFPCEGDFTAQLYHRLRSGLRYCVVTPEYRTPSAHRSRIDLFVSGERSSVGIEVKINYDNFKGKGTNAETAKLSRKFKAMSNDHHNHTNILVVIQGQDAHKGDNKRSTLSRLRQEGADFGLMYYDEHQKKAIGPVKP